MDNVLYSWSSPQEDEFALLLLGASSAYQALLIPSLMHSPRRLLDISIWPRGEQEAWAAALLYFLKLLKVQQNKPMILKSPTHGFRLPVLRKLFPGARYLRIDRNPYEVFASNLILWASLLDQFSLERIVPSEIDDFIVAAYVLHEELIEEYELSCRASRVEVVSYEEMVNDPLPQLERVYGVLELGNFSPARARIKQYLEKVKSHVRNRLRISIAQKERIDSAWGGIMRRKGYSWPDGFISLTQ